MGKFPVSPVEPSRWRDGRVACLQGGLPAMLKSACLGEQLGASHDLGLRLRACDVWLPKRHSKSIPRLGSHPSCLSTSLPIER